MRSALILLVVSLVCCGGSRSVSGLCSEARRAEADRRLFWTIKPPLQPLLFSSVVCCTVRLLSLHVLLSSAVLRTVVIEII